MSRRKQTARPRRLDQHKQYDSAPAPLLAPLLVVGFSDATADGFAADGTWQEGEDEHTGFKVRNLTEEETELIDWFRTHGCGHTGNATYKKLYGNDYFSIVACQGWAAYWPSTLTIGLPSAFTIQFGFDNATKLYCRTDISGDDGLGANFVDLC